MEGEKYPKDTWSVEAAGFSFLNGGGGYMEIMFTNVTCRHQEWVTYFLMQTTSQSILFVAARERNTEKYCMPEYTSSLAYLAEESEEVFEPG